MGWFKHTDTYGYYLRWIKPKVSVKYCKRRIAAHAKKKQDGRNFSTTFSTTNTAKYGQKLPPDWAGHCMKKPPQAADSNGLQGFLRGSG